ncbi:TIGR03621 family F420-dependent LLM class oxidoreductase [Actinomadura rupiterrae]|uniref:TIGR03621 family F420-dependent LLM class oxidoreductase n=1 Tax=Actinomadura rupiterrae TaxID=559627 RepID=UPI0020A49FEB|nr:TIGR03621 family F420-dependent LLM class oxidoreductase [Actinomadura rupiterrae]MCP2339004.1 putative F420-dependent oxidoreductase [Actinomadura rupiterrae]
MRRFRFGFNFFEIRSREEFAAQCRRGEEYGFDVAFVPDHLGSPAPFPTMVAAADATERLRVGSLVLNAPFWNPHLLAREVASVDRLTGGRLELGLGAGHMKWEFDEAGIPWEGFAARARRLEETVEELGRLFAADRYEQRAKVDELYDLAALRPVQRTGFGGFGPPLLIGGTGDRVLRIAAKHADTVAIAGTYQVPGAPPGTLMLATAEQAAERVAFVREQAGERFAGIELNALVQRVMITEDRRGTVEKLAAQALPHMTLDEALDTPFLLVGTAEQIAEQLRESRERFGFSNITVHGPFLDVLGPVLERLL